MSLLAHIVPNSCASWSVVALLYEDNKLESTDISVTLLFMDAVLFLRPFLNRKGERNMG
jgi:hypothetical protein